MTWAILHLGHPVTIGQIAGFATLIIFGFVILYSLRFMFTTLTVILQDAGNIHFVWHQLQRLGMRPDVVYPYYLRVMVMSIFPVAFFNSVPSRVIIEVV